MQKQGLAGQEEARKREIEERRVKRESRRESKRLNQLSPAPGSSSHARNTPTPTMDAAVKEEKE